MQALFQFSQHLYEKREGSGSVPLTNGSGSRRRSGSPVQVNYIDFSVWAGKRRTDPYQIGKYSTVYWIKVFITVFRVFNTASRLVCFLSCAKFLAHCQHAVFFAGRFSHNIGARRVGLLGHGTHQKSGRPCHQVQNFYVSYKRRSGGICVWHLPNYR
jgi:hypothetical protein